MILAAPLARSTQRPAFPSGDAQRPGESIALRVVLARAREHPEKRSLRNVLRVRRRDAAGGERAKPRPQQRKRRPQCRAIAIRETHHQTPQFRPLAALHTRSYLSLSGQSSHGKGQSSPHGSLQRKPVAAHPSAGNASATSSATHLSFMSASSSRPRTTRGLHLL